MNKIHRTKTYVVAYFRARDEEGAHDWEPSRYSQQSPNIGARPHRSVWVIRTSRLLDDLAERLERELHRDDRVLLLECGPHATWAELGPVMADWFADRSFEPYEGFLSAHDRLPSRVVGSLH